MIHQIILAYCILTTCIVESTTYGLVGGTVTLNTNIKDIPDDILWKHNGNKVVEVDGQKQNAFGSFLNRITLDRSSADLTITDLSYEDSGEYVLEIYNKGLTRYNHNLEVIDKVAKPTISCKMNTNSSSSTSANQATLMCSSEPGQFQSLMKFDWSSHEKSGQDVMISLGDQHDDQEYTCTVSNPVSKESTTFTAKDCYKGDDPGALDVSIVSGIGISIGIAFASLLLMALLFCKLKHKACFAEGNDEKRASYGETEGSRNGEEQKPLLNQSEKKGTDSDKKASNGEEEKSALANPVSPLVQPCLPLTTEPVNMLPKEDAGETEEKIDCTPQRPVQIVKTIFEPKPGEQKLPVSGKKPRTPSTNDKEDTDTISESDKNPETITASANPSSAVQPLSEDDENKEDANSDQDSDKTTTEKNAEESEPSGNRLEEETSSLEQKDAEATVHETNSKQADVETHSGKDNQQDSEHNETVKNLPLENSQQPQSLLTPEPDHQTTCQESSDTEQAASHLEEKENNSDSGSRTEETDEGEAVEPPNILPKEDPDEHKEDANSHQVTGETQEKIDYTPQRPVQEVKKRFEPKPGEQKPPVPSKKPLNPFRNDKENTDVTQARESTENKVSECDPADPEKASEQPVSESDKKADEDKETITASANAPSAVQPLSEDDEHKEDANSDQDSDKKNAEESEPSGNRLGEETNSPEQKGAEATVNETNSTQADMETHSGEDNQQPQSPITPEPDHINTNTCQESSGTEQAASDVEKENVRDSGNRTEETNKESKVQRSESVRQTVERFEKESGQQKEVEPKKPPTPSRNDKQDTDVTQDRESTENKVTDSDPADPVNADVASPGDKSDKNADEDEEPRTASANASPVVQPVSENSEHKEDANPDQDSDNTTTETNAEDSDRLKKVSNHEPVVDKEDDKTGKNLPLENSQQPQSLITPGPDHINTNTCQESSGIEQAASDLEEKENNRDSGSGTEETDEGEADDKNKVQREPEDEKSKRSDQ